MVPRVLSYRSNGGKKCFSILIYDRIVSYPDMHGILTWDCKRHIEGAISDVREFGPAVAHLRWRSNNVTQMTRDEYSRHPYAKANADVLAGTDEIH